MNCRLYLPSDYEEGKEHYPVIYVNGEIPMEGIMTVLVNKGVRADFLLLSVKPKAGTTISHRGPPLLSGRRRKPRRAGRTPICPAWQKK